MLPTGVKSLPRKRLSVGWRSGLASSLDRAGLVQSRSNGRFHRPGLAAIRCRPGPRGARCSSVPLAVCEPRSRRPGDQQRSNPRAIRLAVPPSLPHHKAGSSSHRVHTFRPRLRLSNRRLTRGNGNARGQRECAHLPTTFRRAAESQQTTEALTLRCRPPHHKAGVQVIAFIHSARDFGSAIEG
jgi:hypothetical protein